MKRVGDIIQRLAQFRCRLWLQSTVSRHLDGEVETYLDSVLHLQLYDAAKPVGQILKFVRLQISTKGNRVVVCRVSSGAPALSHCGSRYRLQQNLRSSGGVTWPRCRVRIQLD